MWTGALQAKRPDERVSMRERLASSWSLDSRLTLHGLCNPNGPTTAKRPVTFRYQATPISRTRLYIQEKTMQAGRSVDDAGFSIVESLIALGLVFGVMVGLLATVNIGVRGIITGRQRSVAISIANEVMETARNRSYADVGHDLDSDPTLAGDPTLQGTVPNLVFTDLSPEPNEPLVGSVVDAGEDAGDHTNELFPFSPHRWTTQREATTYTTSVYVTRVVPVLPATGDPYRRLTVIVTWDRSLHAAGIPASVRLSSFLFNAIQPPDPLFVGLT
jgi:type II secretory pathway pseudopilin PulG